MNVGKSVTHALQALDQGDSEHAMLHACNATDGTAKKRFRNHRVRSRFTSFLRELYWVVEPMGAPGINLQTSRWQIRVGEPPKVQIVDFAELVYLVHRCVHGHGEELPGGFQLLPDVHGPDLVTHMVGDFVDETVQLSDRVIPALVCAAVVAPENADQRAAEGSWLSYEGRRFIVNECWGVGDRLAPAFASYERMARVTMNLTDAPNPGD